MSQKVYLVKADCDPTDWTPIPAPNAYYAAASYCGYCVVRPGHRLTLGLDDIIEIRYGLHVCRVPKWLVMQYANWRANEDERKLKEARKPKPWRDPLAGPE